MTAPEDLTAVALRKVLASEARVEAAKATKKAVGRIASDKRTRSWWKEASKAEKAAFQRKVYYEHVDKFYRAAEDAAKQSRKEAEQLLKKSSKNAKAAEQKRVAEVVEEATQVKPVAARLPQNHQYAGKEFPRAADVA